LNWYKVNDEMLVYAKDEAEAEQKYLFDKISITFEVKKGYCMPEEYHSRKFNLEED